MKETVVASVALVIASTMNISAMEPLHQENGFVLPQRYIFESLSETLSSMCSNGDIDGVIRFLNDNAARLNSIINVGSHKFGMTPLMRAAGYGYGDSHAVETRAELIRILMGRGADASITNNCGRTALDMILERELKCGREIEELLIKDIEARGEVI